jgi:hypothetical protein
MPIENHELALLPTVTALTGLISGGLTTVEAISFVIGVRDDDVLLPADVEALQMLVRDYQRAILRVNAQAMQRRISRSN